MRPAEQSKPAPLRQLPKKTTTEAASPEAQDRPRNEAFQNGVIGPINRHHRTGIPLTRGAPEELAVDPRALVRLGSDDVQTTENRHAVFQADVGAAAGHAGGDGDAAAMSGARNQQGLLTVTDSIQDPVATGQPLATQKSGDPFTGIHGPSADQQGLAAAVPCLDLMEQIRLLLIGGGTETGARMLAQAGKIAPDADKGRMIGMP